MAEIQLKAWAKINLTLNVLSRRKDGYHSLEMVMQQIDLADVVKISIGAGHGPIRVESDSPWVPEGKTNIAFQAARLIRETYGIDRQVDIFIKKNIPVAAGLGGSSTDAAAVLLGLNRLFELNLNIGELMKLGEGLGADVPFCIMGGTALASGKGEILTPLVSAAALDLLLVKPPFSVSTAWAYKSLNVKALSKRADNYGMIKALKKGDRTTIASKMVNALEEVTASKHTEVLEIKRQMIETGALGAVMSGSGPTVVGLFVNNPEAKAAAGFFNRIYEDVIVTKTAVASNLKCEGKFGCCSTLKSE